MRVGNSPLAPGRLWLLLAGAFCCCSCAGGGPTLYPVEGKILLKGQPLAGATVTFWPKQGDQAKMTPSTGNTDEEGNFKLETGNRIGAPPGDYDVTVIQSRQVPSKNNKGGMSIDPVQTEDALHGAYAKRTKSQLTATIKAGESQLPPFDLK
ncbi:MAG TPA: carboxypeptidase-like regulatory domain-containing protein [Gemmataceae bacterium]|jgi:hypothetical protein|nr:carboxypeptidase-like regulatory domain-containing protein [Gemmataceae bacterium]